MDYDEFAAVITFPRKSIVRVITEGESVEDLATTQSTNAIIERAQRSMQIICNDQKWVLPAKLEEKKIFVRQTDFSFIPPSFNPYSRAGRMAVQAMAENSIYTFSDDKITSSLIMSNNLAGIFPIDKAGDYFDAVKAGLTDLWEPFGNVFAVLGFIGRNFLWILACVGVAILVALIARIIG